jgi:hypothetical protein
MNTAHIATAAFPAAGATAPATQIAAGLSAAGWAIMLAANAAVMLFFGWCLYRVLRKK